MEQRHSLSTPESLALRLRAMIESNWITQALYVTAQLGLPDLLASGPQTSASLSQATGAHAPSLHRLLQALVTLDIVRERDEGDFALLPLGALLQNDAAMSQRSWAMLVGGYHWQLWGHLLDSVKTGESVRKLLTGTEGFRDLEQDPALAALFNHAMVESSRLVVPAVVQAYDFGGLRRIIDVGGGYGELLVAILQANPEACGVLFDLPHAIAQGRQYVERADLAHRCACMAGDFFESVPGGGGAYVLKGVLHSWNDEQSTIILANCRRAMPEGAKLLIIGRIIPERWGASPADQARARGDLNMLIQSASRERTEADFRALLAVAGFHLTKIMPVGRDSSILEATLA
jgi:orsellinic acid C2-O-methyltransferase